MTARGLGAVLVLAPVLALPGVADGASTARAKAFTSCSAVGEFARKQAARIVGPWGLPFRFAIPTPPPPPRTPQPFDGSGPPAAPQDESVRGTDYSGTNVQEEGVDEPDIVKTDGRRLYVMSQSTLHVLDVGDGEPKLIGSLALKGSGHELLVAGDRVLALGTFYDDPVLEPKPDRAAASDSYPYVYREPATRLFEIDVSDPAAPKLLNTLTVEGFYVSARLRESVARIVVSTPPSPWTAATSNDRSADTLAEREARERQAIRRTRLATWVPDGVLRDRIRRTREVQRMVACDDIRRPASFSGPGMLTVLTVDLARGLEPLDSDSLMTDAQTIYASKKSLFVATERWLDPEDPDAVVEPGRFTAIHRFGIADPESAEYRATGQVRGFVLNQFSLSEHDGVLRVATTEQPPWRAGAEQRDSESFVTVLGEDGPVLRQLGRVGGLGKGERIYAVRFMDDIGFVVTFRQVDPLYTLDLSDPRAPAVRGELKIPGFSSYLHPLGDGLLLGIGQDATDGGQTRGAQLSLFDVSDLSAPRRLFQHSLGEYASSEAEQNHHAFLYWPPTKLSVVPVALYGSEEERFVGALGFEIDRESGITERGRAQHEAQDGGTYAWPIRRSLVVGGRLLTVSHHGVLASTLDSLAPIGFTAFESPSG